MLERRREVQHAAMKQVIMVEDGLVERLAIEAVVTVGSATDDKGLATRQVECHLTELCATQDILRCAGTDGIEA